MMPIDKVRVRFAPSPTGFLHVGGLRTALFNYLFAKNKHGKFILRIEDTDKSREVPGALENIQDTLKTFGLNYDEGPVIQSTRLDIYKKYIDELIEKKAAYKCYCTAERIDELKKQAELSKAPFRYDKYCLNHPEQTGNVFVIRQNVSEEGFTEFDDLVYGHIRIENRILDDGILMKSDGYPVYNFANVVDDHLMDITHVIRGEEFVPSTPKHIMLYNAFGWQIPQFAHLPLLLDKNRKKLSKREADVAVKDYLEKGYLPEAILNFIAFLGWNPKTEREIFSLEELAEEFDLAKVNKSGAVFDLDKLNWFNAQYIKQKPLQELLEIVKPFLGTDVSKYEPDFLQKIVEIERERLTVPTEIGERAGYFFELPSYEAKLLRWKDVDNEELKISLEKSKNIISSMKTDLSKMEIQEIFFKEIGDGDKGEVLWPLRVAMTGAKASPGPFEIIEAFFLHKNGKQEIISRIDSAIEKFRDK